MSAASPLMDVGLQADRMGRQNGREYYQQLAFYCLALTALASVVQTVGQTWRDMVRDRRQAERQGLGR